MMLLLLLMLLPLLKLLLKLRLLLNLLYTSCSFYWPDVWFLKNRAAINIVTPYRFIRCEGLCSPLNPLEPTCSWVCGQCAGQISPEFVNTLLLGIQEEGRNFKVYSLYILHGGSSERKITQLDGQSTVTAIVFSQSLTYISPHPTQQLLKLCTLSLGLENNTLFLANPVLEKRT